jgi:hypothetical protein
MQSVHFDLCIEVRDYTTRPPSPESQNVRILRQNLDTKMSPPMLILLRLTTKEHQFLAQNDIF